MPRTYYLVVDGALPGKASSTTTTTNYEHGIRFLRKFVKRHGGAGAIVTEPMTMLPPAAHPSVLYYVRRDVNGKLKVVQHILPMQHVPEAGYGLL